MGAQCSALPPGNITAMSIHANVNQLSYGEPSTKISFDDLKKHQVEDSTIGPVYRLVKNSEHPTKTKLKSMPRKSRLLARYHEHLSINEQGILIKTTKSAMVDSFTSAVPPDGV